MCGGFSPERDMDDEVKAIAMSLKAQVESIANATYATYIPVKFQSQVVAGTNYTIKIKVDGDKMIQIKVFKPLPCNGDTPVLKDFKML